MSLGHFWKVYVRTVLDQDIGADFFDEERLSVNSAVLVIVDGTGKTVTTYSVPLADAQSLSSKVQISQRSFL